MSATDTKSAEKWLDKAVGAQCYAATSAATTQKITLADVTKLAASASTHSPGQRIADAVERYCVAREAYLIDGMHDQLIRDIDEAKAAIAREIDAAMKATAASVHLEDLT